MGDFWRQYEGQVIDNRFRLRQCLAGTDDSAVFLTQSADPQPRKAVIKFIPAGPSADLQLSLWRRAMRLAHPNLLRIFDIGRCRLENRDRLYTVMEYAEEDLSQIIPHRPLTASEAREMLTLVLNALVYLHGNGLLHSRIKPSNIHATADQLKLSSDALFPMGESRKSPRKFDVHDAPETVSSSFSAAADVWSLGVTLVEILAQRVPSVRPGSQGDLVLPDSIPQPFLDIARHALRRDPRRRWTVLEIAARLNLATAQSISPLTVPLSADSAAPAAKLQTTGSDISSPIAQAESQRPQTTKPPKKTLIFPNYAVPAVAGLFVIVAVMALPKILGHFSGSSSPAATAAAQPAAPSNLTGMPARHETPSLPKVSASLTAQNSLKTTARKKFLTQPRSSPVDTPTPAPVRVADTFSSANAPGASAPSSPARGEILEQVLPDAPGKALATIQGTVRVGIRVHVDPAGNVSGAEFDSPGPSQYFADLALKAARHWQFASPKSDNRNLPSEWLIRFEFTPAGPKAFPRQTAP